MRRTLATVLFLLSAGDGPAWAAASAGRGHTREWLAIVALLLLWLLTRMQRAEAQRAADQRARHQRRSPTTPEELGRAVFEVARNRDLRAWRSLFLNGPEAAELMGPEAAEDWLEAREAQLQPALERLAAEVGPDDHYAETRLMENRSCFLVVRRTDGSSAFVPVGQVARVGAVYRLVQPAGESGGRRPHRSTNP